MANIITKFTSAQEKSLNNMCTGANNAQVGTMINNIIDSINNDIEYTLPVLTEALKETLDNLCIGIKTVKLGTVLDNIINCINDVDDMSALTTEEVALLDGGIKCPTLFKLNGLGTKLQAIITAVNNDIESIAVTNEKTTYYVNDEFDFNTGKIVATYETGTKDIDLDDADVLIEGFDSSATDAVQEITVTYGGKTTTFNIEILDALESIAVSGVKTTYIVGDTYDTLTGKIVATYTEAGDNDVLLDAEGVVITGFDSTEPATTQTITVAYGGKTETYTVAIVAVAVSSIAVDGVKTSYVVGASFDFATGKIVATNNNETTADVLLNAEGVVITGFDSATPAATQTITVAYSSKTTTYVIAITAE